MQFEYYGEFKDLVTQNCVYEPIDTFSESGVIRINVGSYHKIDVWRTSVTSTFHKVFRYSYSSNTRDGICIFLPDFDYLISLITLRDIDRMSQCKKWIDLVFSLV